MKKEFRTLLLALVGITHAGVSVAKPKAYIDIDDKGPHLMVDGKRYVASFWESYGSSKDAFKSNPKAYELIAESASNNAIGNTIFYGGLTASIGTAVYGNKYTYWGTYFGSIIGGIYFWSKSSAQFIKAMNTYNGVYGDSSGSKTTFKLIPATDGMLLSVSYDL